MSETRDMAMEVIRVRLDAYDQVFNLALYGEPEGQHRPNGAYVEGWRDAMEAVLETLRSAGDHLRAGGVS